MKKSFFLAAALIVGLAAQAEVLVDETFTDFPTGWTTSGKVTTPENGARTQVEALVYSNEGGTYILSGQGNAVQHAYDASEKYFHTKQLETPIKQNFYLSFLVRPDGEQKATNSQVFGLGTGAASAALRVWMGKDPSGDKGKCRVGITRSSGTSADVQWGTELLSVNETHLFVIKYTMGETDTVASLFVDPVIGGEEPATAFAQDGEKNGAKKSFSHLCFYSQGSSKTYCTVGGVRVATTWEDIVTTTTTKMEETKVDAKAVKTIENGQVVIYRDNKKYNLLGVAL